MVAGWVYELIKLENKELRNTVQKLELELVAANTKIKNLSGGVKFDDPVEKLHYDHWVDRTLKINSKGL